MHLLTVRVRAESSGGATGARRSPPLQELCEEVWRRAAPTPSAMQPRRHAAPSGAGCLGPAAARQAAAATGRPVLSSAATNPGGLRRAGIEVLVDCAPADGQRDGKREHWGLELLLRWSRGRASAHHGRLP
nr:unnamed protein product [Digitaria exilis]